MLSISFCRFKASQLLDKVPDFKEKLIPTQDQKVEDVRRVLFNNTESRDVFKAAGKEGSQRWSLVNGNIVCKELIKVDGDLLWADVMGQEEMAAVEEDKDLLVIPVNTKTDLMEQAVTLNVDVANKDQ